MKISRIRLYVVNVPERRWWWSDDVYGQPMHQRSEHGIVEVETDAGLIGLTQIERNTPSETMISILNSWLGQTMQRDCPQVLYFRKRLRPLVRELMTNTVRMLYLNKK